MSQEDVNRQTYSTPRALEIYTTSYLWPYETVLFQDYLNSGMKVLDIGCGVGRLDPFWRQYQVAAVGIDMVPQFIEQAKRLYPQSDFRIMNASQLEFPDNSFDFVFFSNQGIDYTEQRLEVLREAHRVTKPGAIFAYSGHNSLCIPRTFKAWKNFFRNISQWRPWYHFRLEHHPNGDLHVAHNNIWLEQRLIKQAGFDVVEILSNNRRYARLPKILVAFTRWPLYVCRKSET